MLRKPRGGNDWVSDRVYREHLRLFPKVAVDVVAGTSSSEFVLVRRNDNNNEWRGSWATPGGGLLRDERLVSAAHRILVRETGLSAHRRDFEFRGVEEVITPLEHAVTVIFRVVVKKVALKIDETSSEARWFRKSEIPRNLKTLYQRILLKSGMLG